MATSERRNERLNTGVLKGSDSVGEWRKKEEGLAHMVKEKVNGDGKSWDAEMSDG